MEEIKLCDYGCGKEAIHQFKNGKWCCETSYNKCPENKEKNSNRNIGHVVSIESRRKSSESNKGKHDRTIAQLESQSKKMKDLRSDPSSVYNTKEFIEKNKKCNFGKKREKLSFYLKKYPYLSDYEVVEEDPITKDLIVKCKVCGVKFTATRDQILGRVHAIKNNKFSYGLFYCSKECRKINICKYNNEWELYKWAVVTETNESLRKNGDKIKNLKLRSRLFPLDHKYSTFEGFKNNIDPKIIGHWKNLEIIPQLDNNSKRDKCSITIDQLLIEIDLSYK